MSDKPNLMSNSPAPITETLTKSSETLTTERHEQDLRSSVSLQTGLEKQPVASDTPLGVAISHREALHSALTSECDKIREAYKDVSSGRYGVQIKKLSSIRDYAGRLEHEPAVMEQMLEAAKRKYEKASGKKKDEALAEYMKTLKLCGMVDMMQTMSSPIVMEALRVNEIGFERSDRERQAQGKYVGPKIKPAKHDTDETIDTASLKRAFNFPLTKAEIKPAGDGGVSAVGQVRTRLLMTRSLLVTKSYDEQEFRYGSWEEDMKANQRQLVKPSEKDGYKIVDLSGGLSWDSPLRLGLLPKALWPESETDRNGVYKTQYDRMDFSLFEVSETLRALNEGIGDKDPGVSAMHKALQRVWRGFTDYFQRVGETAERILKKKDCSQEKKDEMMLHVSQLSFRYGLLSMQLRSVSKTVCERFEKMHDEDKADAVSELEKMAQSFEQYYLSEYRISLYFSHEEAFSAANQMLDCASGVFQFAQGLTMSDVMGDLREFRNPLGETKEGDPVNVLDSPFVKLQRKKVAETAVSDDSSYDVGDLKEARQQEVKKAQARKAIDDEIDAERQRLLDLEEQARQTHISALKEQTTGLDSYIPAHRIESLDDYKIGARKYAGVGKCKAFFIRHGSISGGKLRDAMNAHIDRFLASEHITDEDTVKAADAVADSSGLFSNEMQKHWSRSDIVREKLTAVNTLMKAGSLDEIRSAVARVKNITGKFGSDELSPDSKFFDSYPYSAKIIYLDKLLRETPDIGAAVASSTKKEKKLDSEFTIRLDALKSTVGKLKDSVTGSTAYRNYLDVQTKMQHLTESSSQLESMYSGGADRLVSRRVSTVRTEADKKDAQAVKQRLKEAKEIDSDVLLDDEEYKKLQQQADEERTREGFERVTRKLAGLSKERERSRLAMLTKTAPPRPYRLVAGEAAQEILKDSVRRQILDSSDLPKDVQKILRKDFDTIFKAVLAQVSTDAPGGAKSVEDLKNLSPTVLSGYATLISKRVDAYKKILSDHPEFSEIAAFRSALISDVIGENYDALSDEALASRFIDHKAAEKLKAKKEDILLLGEPFEESRVYFDISGLKASKTLKGFKLRAFERYERMRNADKLYSALGNDSETFTSPKSLRQKITGPSDYYSYVRENGLFSEDPSTVQKSYIQYLDDWKTSALIKHGKKLNGQALADLEKDLTSYVSALTEEEKGNPKFIYGGISHFGTDIPALFSDSINDSKRSVFETKMQKSMFRYIERLTIVKSVFKSNGVDFTQESEKQLGKLILSEASDAKLMIRAKSIAETANDPDMQKAVRRKDSRIKALSVFSDGAYRPLIPILLENKTFSLRLVTDTDKNWSDYAERITRNCATVMKELLVHPYLEQYLVGKRAEISALLVSEKEPVASSLKLDEYDRELGDVTFKNGKTLDKIIGGVLKSKNKAFDGNLLINVLLLDGVSAVLDEKKLKSYKERSETNLALLTKAVEAALEKRRPKGREQTETEKADEEATKAAILHNERANIFSADSSEYSAVAAKNVEDWFTRFSAEAEVHKSIIEDLKKTKEHLAQYVERKEKGRKAFVDYSAETQLLRDTSLASRKRSIEPSPEQKELINKFLSEANSLPADGSLNAFYSQTLTRIASRTAEEDRSKILEHMQRDYTVFLNAKLFHSTATAFLSDKYGDSEAKQRSLLNGLFDFYGEKILDGSALLTEKYLTSSFKRYLSRKDGSTEAERFLSDDTLGLSSFSSTQTFSEASSFMGQKTREEFEVVLKEKAGRSVLASYNSLTNEEKVLVGKLLEIDCVRDEPMSALEKKLRGESAANTTKNDLIFSYLSDAPIQAANYTAIERVLTGGEKFRDSYISQAISVVLEVRSMKESETFEVSKEEYRKLMSEEVTDRFEEDEVTTAMLDLAVTIERVQDEIKKLDGYPDEGKLLYYHSVLRSYVPQMEQYKKTTDWDPGNIIGSALEDFHAIEAYFAFIESSTEEEKNTSAYWNKLHEIATPLLGKLELYVSSSVSKSRKSLNESIEASVFATCGVSLRSVYTPDKSEAEFPDEVLDAVHKVDAWMAKNRGIWGNGSTDGLFGSEILMRPIRERLYMYCAVERGLVSKMSDEDATFSQTLYIPNVEEFAKKFRETKGFMQCRQAKTLSGMTPVVKIDPSLPDTVKDALVDRNKKYMYFRQQAGELERLVKDENTSEEVRLEAEARLRDSLILLAQADEAYKETAASQSDDSLPPVWNVTRIKDKVAKEPMGGLCTPEKALSVLTGFITGSKAAIKKKDPDFVPEDENYEKITKLLAKVKFKKGALSLSKEDGAALDEMVGMGSLLQEFLRLGHVVLERHDDEDEDDVRQFIRENAVRLLHSLL